MNKGLDMDVDVDLEIDMDIDRAWIWTQTWTWTWTWTWKEIQEPVPKRVAASEDLCCYYIKKMFCKKSTN
jgi:hypothetical protein